MNKDNNLKKNVWYNNEKNIVDLILVCILVIILCTQSFPIKAGGSLDLFSSIINHNSIYLLVLIYFGLLKFPFGKKLFNYLNLFLIFIYFIFTVTSLITVVQNFQLNTVLSFTLNFIIAIYLSHTFFRDSYVWKEYHLDKSPFNELSNDFFMYSIIIVSLFLLAVNLISIEADSGVVVSFLDTIYIVLFGRYIFLYNEYLNKKKINIDNEGNFDELREKVDDILDKTEIDDKIVEIGEKIIDTSKDLKDKASDFIEEKELDKKIDDIKEKISDTSSEIKEKIDASIKDKEIDKKTDDLSEKASDVNDSDLEANEVIDEKDSMEKEDKKVTDKVVIKEKKDSNKKRKYNNSNFNKKNKNDVKGDK